MYGREEAKQLRKDFWTNFGQISKPKRRALGRPKNWISYNTGISEVSLKFDATRHSAIVAIDIDSKYQHRKEKFYNKFLSFQNILNDIFDNELIWNPAFVFDTGKTISRIYIEKEGLQLYNKNHWADFYEFFFDKMIKLEDFFMEYRDLINIKEEEL